VPMPTVYAVGAAVNSTGTALAVPIPAGTVANDVLLMFHEMDPALNAAVLGAVTGYTDVINSPQSQPAATLPTRLTVRWHRATGAESGTVATPVVTNHQIAQIVGIRGAVTSGNPWNVTSGSIAASSGTVNFPTATTTAIDCLIVHAFTTGADTNTGQQSGTPTNAALANIAVQANSWTLSGTGGGVAVVTGQKATAGAIGTTTTTNLTAANAQALMTIAMQGAVVVAPPHRGTVRMSRAAVQRASRW
jgi:hypothetical protein